MTERHIAVAEVLMDIECALRQVQLWQEERPSAEALASDQPFCVDTLEFHQWLQFILLPRMRLMVERKSALPTACGIAPMAEEVYQQERGLKAPLIAQLQRLDQLFGQT